ncbi:RNA polymerase sigma factor SigJ [Paenibacillus allorhizosphaerae]|uniref:ECF RNA polymerase sigma factor SigJ n=1 Tax=Paenibacillus allorhizosphaerae TaxID=2849866 RepID=A0ABM8VTX2_9BACL|nr:RNA polymerase sigma factor SigJ [Paenibacillus allorhizosphaerae]CAG7658277.1 ECF RNA polymerase sigma factor SigJ [Paenibacillus allorhizosphaerae]
MKLTMSEQYGKADVCIPNENLALSQAFETQRPRLLRVAYSIVGSVAEAEDCVQEAWMRLQRMKEPAGIRDLSAFLTTTVGRLALDALDRVRTRREQYVGTWLPEPLVEDVSAGDPHERVALDESVSMALMVVLERLTTAERTAFLLHDVFGLSFEEIAVVVGRSSAAVRQLASRARQHVESGRPRFAPTEEEQRAIVSAFAAACQEGDLEGLARLLDPQVVWRSDGGGKVRALPRITQGTEALALGFLAYTKQATLGVRVALVNGAPGLVLRDSGGVITVVSITIDNKRIVAVDVIRNPDKLTTVRFPDEASDCR